MIDIVIVGALYAGAKAYDLKQNNSFPRASGHAFSVHKAKAAFQKFKEEKIKPLFGTPRSGFYHSLG